MRGGNAERNAAKSVLTQREGTQACMLGVHVNSRPAGAIAEQALIDPVGGHWDVQRLRAQGRKGLGFKI